MRQTLKILGLKGHVKKVRVQDHSGISTSEFLVFFISVFSYCDSLHWPCPSECPWEVDLDRWREILVKIC